MLVRANPEASSVHSALGAPIDIAHAHGKSDDEVLPLLEGFMREAMAEMETREIDLIAADMTKPELDHLGSSVRSEAEMMGASFRSNLSEMEDMGY
jgi:hypothetical protein